VRRAAAGLVTLAALSLGACAKPAATPGPAARTESPRAVAPEVWSYEVAEDGADLAVTATFPAGTSETLSIERETVPYVASVATAAGEVVAPSAGIWTIPSCARGCTLTYRFELDRAARSLGDVDSAARMREGIESPPSSWLLRPMEHAPGTTYRFHVRAAPNAHFATGVRPVDGASDTYQADAGDLDTAPYSLFGTFRSRTVTPPGASIALAIMGGKLALDDAAIDRWIDASARAIEAYYGRFPVPRFLLILVPRRGGRGETVEGRTLASGGSSILLGVSEGMTEDEIPRDWVLTHEMTHLALPSLPRENHWLEEGLATYVEPIARAKVGTIPADEVWRGLVDGLPNGEPAAGDEGLDRTHTWGRTYWGGALFAFVADVQIRKRTGGARSLEDALQKIVATGGTGETRAPIVDVLRTGDEALGAPVLEELYAKWSREPVRVDLPQLWSELGVRASASGIAYDEKAPLAAIRRGIAP
jgi:hypothetical protein